MTIYYISNTGNDSNSGLSELLAWQTLSKVNSTTLYAGDQVLLKRGDTWHEQLTIPNSGLIGNPIVVTSYGSGNKPKLYGSDKITLWTDQGSNIWRSTNTISQPWTDSSNKTANIFFIKNDLSIQVGMNNLTPDSEFDWYWSANYIYVYSASNPATTYSSIEAAQRAMCININKKDYITIDGIDCFFSEASCIDVGQSYTVPQSGITVRNCEVAYTGYPDNEGYGISVTASDVLVENNIVHDCGRRGVCIALYANITISNIIIQNNVFYKGNHTTSLDLQVASGYTGTVNNLTFRYNLVYEDINYIPTVGSGTMLMFLSDQNTPLAATLTNIKIEYNVFKYPPGVAVNANGVDSGYFYNNTFYGIGEGMTGLTAFLFLGNSTFTVKNNIFYSQLLSNSNSRGLIYYSINTTLIADNNIYYRADPSYYLGRLESSYFTYANSAAFLSAIKGDNNSKFVDPKFISSTNLNLQSSSEAINSGINIGITTDHVGHLIQGLPDIGAYEYIQSINPLGYKVILKNGNKYYINPVTGKFYVR